MILGISLKIFERLYFFQLASNLFHDEKQSVPSSRSNLCNMWSLEFTHSVRSAGVRVAFRYLLPDEPVEPAAEGDVGGGGAGGANAAAAAEVAAAGGGLAAEHQVSCSLLFEDDRLFFHGRFIAT